MLGLRITKNDTLLKDGKGRKLRAGWHERNVERDWFGSRTGLLGLHDPNRLSWRVRGHKEVDCGGRRAPVGAARAALGGGGRASLAQPPWRWRANHAPLELLLRLHATHLAVMGKKRGGGQAVRALPGVPSDSVACDNLVWLY